ncbi:MAG: short-chain Z-isoprenyl diphosphate synthase [Glaciecola sp.]
MDLQRLLYPAYERQLLAALDLDALPAHVAVILDGNRRFAKVRGKRPTDGHRAGAAKIDEFLQWCTQLSIPYVTLWLLSTDNLDREESELAALLEVIKDTVVGMASSGNQRDRNIRVQPVGALELLPEPIRRAMTEAAEATADNDGLFVQVAVGYGGRREIVDAVQALLLERAGAGRTLDEVARELTDEDIGRHLYTTGMPDPDLIIRTSGEVRLSGFLLWQSAHSEYYFCDPFWPDFRRMDFLRALRDYQRRHRRFGR